MKKIAISLCVLLAGCGTTPAARIDHANAIAVQAGLQRQHFLSRPLQLIGYQRLSDPAMNLRVYIEGDGNAFSSRGRRSSDPTPKQPLMLELAALDTYPNILYLGRPCMYGLAQRDGACDVRYWDEARYGSAVLSSLNQAIASRQQPEQKLELIGYSGGGVLAALLAAGRDDVANLRSLAAPLDVAAWVAHHRISPLTESDDPTRHLPVLQSIPQLHFAGQDDAIVPPAIQQGFLQKLNSRCAELRLLPTSHHQGWHAGWPGLLQMPLPDCRR